MTDPKRKVKLIIEKPDGNPDHFTYQQAIQHAVNARMDILILAKYGAWLAKQEGKCLHLLCLNGHFVPIE